MITLLLILSVLWAVYIQFSHQYRRRMKMASQFPAYPGSLPFIGHGHHFLGIDREGTFELLKSLSEDANKKGGIIVAYLKMRPHFVITDPEDAYTVMNEALDKSYMYKFLSPWLGNGLFTSDAADWYPDRKILSPAFNPGVIASFQSVFEKQARKLTDNLADKVGTGPFEVDKHFERCFLETVYETALGMPEGESVVDVNFARYIHRMFSITIERILKTHLHFNWIFNWSQLKKDQDSVVETLHKISNQIIDNRKAEYENNNDYSDLAGKKFKPFLQHILEQCAFTDKEVREQVDTIILAGEDTSALVLQYIMIMLGSHPRVQDKLYEEIHSVVQRISQENREVTKNDLGKLKYTEAVINETLRLYPIGCIIPRDCNKDIQLRNNTIPAGSTAMISLWGIHRGPRWGPDADSFIPERWLDAATLPDLKTCWGGFSLGKRNCIGKTYAIAAMKTVLVHLLTTYRVKSDASKLTLQVDIMLRPASGNKISLESRLNSF